MKTYEVSLWPNNQPPILLGYYKGTSKEDVRKQLGKESFIDPHDENLYICLKSKNTPIERWRNG
jgi:hypothetical protein